jgi:serine/threonine-protein kinase
MSLAAGARLGPYKILSPLGAGGMGEVYRARDAKLGRDVALKVLLDAFALDAERLARFKREAQVLASLNHPNIAQIYGLEGQGRREGLEEREGQDGAEGPLALVLELVEGPTLADVLASDSRLQAGGGEAELKKVSIAGGPAVSLCKMRGLPRGASWGDDDTIVFATGDIATGLMSVPAGGGEPKVLTKLDPGQGDHVRPSVLPGAATVLFTVSGQGTGNIVTATQAADLEVVILDVKSGERKRLVQGGTQAEYVATGHLIYASEGTLRAVRFDLARLQVLGDPMPVVEQVQTTAQAAANFVVSLGGTLVYVPGAAGSAGTLRTLVWANRQGQEEPLNVPPRSYASPRISPDGTRVALDVRDQNNDIWVWEFARQTLTPLTFDPAPDVLPVWTPDGRRIVFSSARNGQPNLFWQAVDGTGPTEQLTTSPNQHVPTSFPSDAKSLIFQELMPAGNSDIGLLTFGDKPTTEPLIHTSSNELNGRTYDASPDGSGS